jgi:ABC-type glutathione transport system ATPase component
MERLEVRDLSIAFAHSAPVTQGISFDLQAGATTALVGESGSGKSLTALALMGLLPTGGKVVGGQVTEWPSGRVWADAQGAFASPVGTGISMVFQDPMSSLNPSMPVGWQVAEPLQVHEGMGRVEARRRAEELLAEVELPDPATTFDKFPHALSGGQRQRVMIAMALACGPQVLIADEPTTALDVTVQRSVLDLIQRLQAQRGLAVLFVTHDMAVVRDIADQVVVLQAGRVVESGRTAEVLLRPQHPYTQLLVQASESGRAREPRQGAETEVPWIRMRGVVKGFGLPVKNWFSKVKPEPFLALKGIDLDIRAGERIGVVGESGSGKSTLGRALIGLLPIDAGNITYGEVAIDPRDDNSMAAIRAQAQLVFQDPFSALNPRIRVGEALAEALRHRGVPADQARKEARERLVEVGLQAEDAERFPRSFSGGQRQRIVIARALAVDPRLLVLDESVAALDTATQQAVLALIERIAADRGLTLVLISHDLGLVARFCDRLVVMHQGQILEDGPTASVIASPRSQYTRKLWASRPGTRALT